MSDTDAEHNNNNTSNSKPAAAGKKRSRSSGGAASRSRGGALPVIMGDRWVCAYSGHFCKHAVFIPGYLDKCFANIPCALAWLEETVSDETKRDDLIGKLCHAYNQLPSNIIKARDRKHLLDFGGEMDYKSWIQPFKMWDEHAAQNGVTVEQWQESQKKPKKKKEEKLTFEVGGYLVAHNVKQPKRIEGLDGAAAPEVAEGEKAPPAPLTLAGATRKLVKFQSQLDKKKEGEGDGATAVDEGKHGFIFNYAARPGFTAQYLSSFDEVDPKLVNKLASQLTGDTVYGPAIFVFTKKVTLKKQ